jgi:multimeric flavodoxin WrbA
LVFKERKGEVISACLECNGARKMRALLISSSPHKEESSTFLLAKEVLKGLTAGGISLEVIHLIDCHINFCRHCEECHKKLLHCSIKDNTSIILKKMLEAEGIILATPNYINQVTASMKALFDRSAHFIHCKRLLGKYVVGVVSSGSGDDAEVLNYIKYYAHACAAQYSGGVSAAAYALKDKLREAYQLGEKLAGDIKEKKVFPEQMEIIQAGKEHFERIIQLRKDEWQEEYQYWVNKGWL